MRDKANEYSYSLTLTIGQKWKVEGYSMLLPTLPGAGGGQSFKLDSGTQSWLSSRQSDTRHEMFSLKILHYKAFVFHKKK